MPNETRRRRRLRLEDFDEDETLTAAAPPGMPVYATWRALVAVDGYIADTPHLRRVLPDNVEYIGGRNALYSKLTNSSTPHDGPATGHVETVEKIDGTTFAEGVFYDTPEGRNAAMLAANGTFAGVSMDGEAESEAEYGAVVEEETGEYVKDLVTFTKFMWGELTQVSRPAIDGAGFIDINVIEAGEEPSATAEETTQALAASGAPPADIDEQLSEDAYWDAKLPTLTLIASGAENIPRFDIDRFHIPEPPVPMLPHVFEDNFWCGHIAVFGTCHTAYKDRCVTPPRSKYEYETFLQTPIMFTNGQRGRVGKFTTGVGHAATALRPRATVEHYDSNGSNAAFGHVLDGEIGIWGSGVLDPDASQKSINRFAMSPQSGDWRGVRGSLELFASLAVNNPGFPIPDPKEWRKHGEAKSLTAAGVIDPDLVTEEGVEWIEDRLGVTRFTARPDVADPVMHADHFARAAGMQTLAERRELEALQLARKAGVIVDEPTSTTRVVTV